MNTPKPTPKDVRDAQVTASGRNPRTATSDPVRSFEDVTVDSPAADAVSEDPSDEPMIVFNQPTIDENGVATTKQHGPMPVSKWDEYSRKHNL